MVYIISRQSLLGSGAAESSFMPLSSLKKWCCPQCRILNLYDMNAHNLMHVYTLGNVIKVTVALNAYSHTGEVSQRGKEILI